MINLRRKLIWAGLGLVFLASLYLVIILSIWFYHSGRVMPGVSIAGVQYSGRSDKEIMGALNERAETFLKSGNKYEMKFDFDRTLVEAKGALSNPFELGKRKDIPVSFTYNAEILNKDLSAFQKKHQKAVINPVIIKKDGVLAVTDGQPGTRVLYGENVFRFKKMIGSLEGGFILTASEVAPASTKTELEENLVQANQLATRGFTLEYEAKKFEVSEEELASWISAGAKAIPLYSHLTGGFLSALVTPETKTAVYSTREIEGYLATIAKKIDREPINATLKMQDGKAAVFALSQTGLSLNIDESLLAITTALDAGAIKAGLTIDRIEPEITQNSLADLGIVELISEGRSNFSGSPANRRHNIRVGASKFDGIIVKPGETFSFTKNLGPVDASTGYLPELVIKDNETVPEFGGGLCQVSSTAFRAALNAGLPITARRPHAYPVTYYKPWGTDATIYIPNPDLKFTNDTGHHILIQTRISGNYLYFDFYGTKKSGSVKFAGNKEGMGAVTRIEDVKPYIYDNGIRGEGSFTAVFWQFFYDESGKLIGSDDFLSKYDSPLKYPH